ncbi:NAD(P)/FAD-dependent oxidoreductase [Acuticoccus sediminis]|uniref:hypothetical protein n=1 Tax=Acuticoccus sediminis TaxID=2184697 RepID=UPI001CFE709D|nr:hypothetical protein [Acuticoccus sediminis]
MSLALIRGRGVAGLVAARRLARAGWSVVLAGPPHRSDRIVTLDPSVVDLLALELGREVLAAVAPAPIAVRELAWSPGPPETVPGELVAVPLRSLTAAMEERLPPGITVVETPPERSFDEVLDATGRGRSARLRSGARTAWGWTVPLSGPVGRAVLEAHLEGWVFVAPAGAQVSVQVVLPGDGGHELARELARRTLAGRGWFATLERLAAAPPVACDATPAFGDPIAPCGAILVGDAACAEDPLSGSGVGRAVRGAVLGAAVATAAPGDRAAVRRHYLTRLALAHAAHLEGAADFYARSRCAAAFAPAVAAMRDHARHLRREVAAPAILQLDASHRDARLVPRPVRIAASS